MSPIFSGVFSDFTMSKTSAVTDWIPTCTTRPGALERPPHAPRMVGIEGHGLFLINVLARLDGGNEIQRVLVLRRDDHHRVNGLVIQQRAEIAVRFRLRDDALTSSRRRV